MSTQRSSSNAGVLKRISDPANRVGLLAALVILATLAFAVYSALPILDAIRAGGAGSQVSDGSDAVLRFAANIKNDTAQISGRSFFFDPPPPPPPYVPPPPRPPEPERPPPGPPPKPTTYGGPKIIGTVFDTVWFDNGETMRVGGPVKNDLRVISISTAPYVVKVEWKEVVFDVPFLPRDSVITKSRSGSSTTPAPTPPPEPETKPAEPPVATPPADAPSEAKPDAPEEKKEEPNPADKPSEPAPAPSGSPPPDKPPENKDGSP